MALRVEQRAYRVGKADGVAVVALERQAAVGLAEYLHHIYRSDGLGLWVDGVEILYHLLLVGDGDVEACKVGIGGHHLGEHLDGGQLEVDISGVYLFRLKFAVEKILRE